MLVIFYAFKREIAPVLTRLTQRQTRPDLNGFEGRVGNQNILLLATGIGQARARARAEHALALISPPRLAIAAGVAGALSGELHCGDLLLADSLLLRTEVGSPRVFQADPLLLQAAERNLRRATVQFHRGALLTAGSVLKDRAAKQMAGELSGALAVDMESAAVAEVLERHTIPWLCLRAVLDELEDEVIGAELTDAEGRVAPLKAALNLFKHPGHLGRLPAMARKLAQASHALAAGLSAIGGW
jgi:adenosylhomocysteine nucleosidase